MLLVWRRLQLSYQLTCRLTCQHSHSEGTDDGWRSLLEAPGAPSYWGWGALLARLDGAVAVLLGRGCRLKSLEACSAAQMGLVLSALLAGGLCLTRVKPSWEARNAQVTSIEHAVQRAKSRARRANKRKVPALLFFFSSLFVWRGQFFSDFVASSSGRTYTSERLLEARNAHFRAFPVISTVFHGHWF